MRVPQKIKLPYDSAIPLLSRYPKELKAGPQRDICIPTLKIVLVIIAKNWNQPKCPSKDKCIKCDIYIEWNTMQPEKAKKSWHTLQHG